MSGSSDSVGFVEAGCGAVGAAPAPIAQGFFAQIAHAGIHLVDQLFLLLGARRELGQLRVDFGLVGHARRDFSIVFVGGGLGRGQLVARRGQLDLRELRGLRLLGALDRSLGDRELVHGHRRGGAGDDAECHDAPEWHYEFRSR